MAYPTASVGIKARARRMAKNGAAKGVLTPVQSDLDTLASSLNATLFGPLLSELAAFAFVVDKRGRLVNIEGGALVSAGLADRDQSIGRPIADVLSFDAGAIDFREMLRAASGGRAEHGRFVREGRSYNVSIQPVTGQGGQVIGAVGLALDVTSDLETQDALMRSEAILQRAERMGHLGYWEYDIRKRRIRMSDEMIRLYDLEPGANPGRDKFVERMHPEDRDRVRATLIAAERNGTACKGIDYRLIAPDGSIRWLLQQIEVTCDAGGAPLEMHGTVLDITNRKILEEHLKRLAHVDELTALPNRTSLSERLEQVLAARQNAEDRAALLFIDVDGFKTVNDTYGHNIGDRLLQDVARRISDCLRAGDFVARSGGDEFVVLLSRIRNRESVVELAGRIATACARPFTIGPREVYSPVSIGISVAPDDGITADDLLRNADSAMYAAKSAGRNTFRFYSAAMYEDAARELELENDLRRAIARDELFLNYQPIVNAEGVMVAVEALARWLHPTLGLVPPNVFIPIAERNRTISEMGGWIARRACKDLKRFREIVPGLHLALNVSARQFDSENLIAVLEEAVDAAGITWEALDLEITESLVMSDMARAAEILGELRRRGARVSIDDFGTGYSSLAALKRLPIDNLKIDRCFIKDLENDRGDNAIVGAILSVAGALQLNVVAEGVETTGQFDVLNRLGCPTYQGFAFSRPVDVPTIEMHLRDNKLTVTSIA